MEILNVKELAAYLKCSPSVIRSLLKKQKIPFFRIGSKINFRKDSIEAWIKEQETKNKNTESSGKNGWN